MEKARELHTDIRLFNERTLSQRGTLEGDRLIQACGIISPEPAWGKVRQGYPKGQLYL